MGHLSGAQNLIQGNCTGKLKLFNSIFKYIQFFSHKETHSGVFAYTTYFLPTAENISDILLRLHWPL